MYFKYFLRYFGLDGADGSSYPNIEMMEVTSLATLLDPRFETKGFYG